MLRVGKKRQKKKKKKKKENQRQTALEWVKAQKSQKNNNLYDACKECTYDACSNALKFVQFYFINHPLTWTYSFRPKLPNFEEKKFKIQKIDQFIITLVR